MKVKEATENRSSVKARKETRWSGCRGWRRGEAPGRALGPGPEPGLASAFICTPSVSPAFSSWMTAVVLGVAQAAVVAADRRGCTRPAGGVLRPEFAEQLLQHSVEARSSWSKCSSGSSISSSFLSQRCRCRVGPSSAIARQRGSESACSFGLLLL